MGVDGTGDGSIEQCAVVHVDCTGKAMVGRMRYNRDVGVVYCRIGER